MRACFIEMSGSHWVGIARSLAAVHGVDPVLWTGDEATIDRVRAAFPGIATVAGVDAACGHAPDRAANWPLRPLDAPLLRELAVDESIALAMMDRMDQVAGTFGHDARRRHWHDLLRIWNSAIDALNPEIVIFSMTPHVVYDYALYALCKRRKLPTRMFERTAVPGLIYVMERFEQGSDALRRSLKQHDQDAAVVLSTRGREHLAAIRSGGKGALPANYRKKLATRRVLGVAGRQTSVGLVHTLGVQIARTAYVLVRRRKAPANYFVREDRAGRLVSPGAIRWLADRWRGQLSKWRLAHLLKRLSRPIDGCPYILLALHYQPERAIVPMAGALGDQTLIVDMVARTIPNGWKLAVKEHPWQLVPFGRGELSRSASFYRRIAEHPNVILIPHECDTETLLAGARGVATATGSIGWQAIVRGIPTLIFGAAWYRDAPGAHPIDDCASCAKAIAAIERGETPPPDAAERTLAAAESVGVQGYLEPALEDTAGLSEHVVVSAMAHALARTMISSLPRVSSKPRDDMIVAIEADTPQMPAPK